MQSHPEPKARREDDSSWHCLRPQGAEPSSPASPRRALGRSGHDPGASNEKHGQPPWTLNAAVTVCLGPSEPDAEARKAKAGGLWTFSGGSEERRDDRDSRGESLKKGGEGIMGFEDLKCYPYEQLSVLQGNHFREGGEGRRPEAVPRAAGRSRAEPRVAPPSRLAPRLPPRPRKLASGADAPAGGQRRGAEPTPSSGVFVGGVRGRPGLRDRDRGDLPAPHPPRLMQPAPARAAGLTQRRVPRIHGQTQRRHRRGSAGAPVPAPAWLPSPPGTDAPKGRSRKVCAARLTQPQLSPRPLRRGRRGWARAADVIAARPLRPATRPRPALRI